ncbi:TPA: hypothetical protein KPE78_001102 [Clostridioides difficile]|nr:hypothetical protein [Clostridioides difficile]OFU05403.1 hypothetical protein HMPREF3083_08815 [Clostridium sp. HMSC19D07]MBZ0553974.1 hypothetical protein [Clostridioides difficile]MBZ1159306.1 hypothetical protein [Clostridioides difficile]MCE4722400.1 hypothetical protein [Clostridioides difficile]
MAIGKSKILSTGQQVFYWRISTVNISYSNKMAQIKVSGYISEDARREGLDAVEYENISVLEDNFDNYFGINTLDTTGSNPLQSGYNYLKENIDKFKDSLDI